MRGSVFVAALLFAPLLLASPRGDIGGTFQLVDQDGRKVSDRTYQGQPVLMYFGFASCPDVCPTDLARIARIVARVRKDSEVSVTPVFVTVDPERDTPKKLKAYVAIFGSDFVGLTGTPAQVRDIAGKYHVYYRKVAYGTQGQYTMDHSTFLFLLDAKGRYLDHFGRGMDEAAVAQRIGADLTSTATAARDAASSRR